MPFLPQIPGCRLKESSIRFRESIRLKASPQNPWPASECPCPRPKPKKHTRAGIQGVHSNRHAPRSQVWLMVSLKISDTPPTCRNPQGGDSIFARYPLLRPASRKRRRKHHLRPAQNPCLCKARGTQKKAGSDEVCGGVSHVRPGPRTLDDGQALHAGRCLSRGDASK